MVEANEVCEGCYWNGRHTHACYLAVIRGEAVEKAIERCVQRGDKEAREAKRQEQLRIYGVA